MEGAVLDLGCGTGRDVYLASQLAGSDGFVIGVDMTDEQLEVARRHKDCQMARFRISGDRSIYFGPFDRAPASAKEAACDPCNGGACC